MQFIVVYVCNVYEYVYICLKTRVSMLYIAHKTSCPFVISHWGVAQKVQHVILIQCIYIHSII